MRWGWAACVAIAGWGFVGCSLATDGGRLSEGCPEGTKECDGACVSTGDDDFGCGRASCSPCALPHSISGCSADGECTVSSCVGSFEDCDRDPENGCEVDLDTDVKNCRDCGSECEDPEFGVASCAEAQCYVRSCEKPRFDCNFDFEDGCEVNLETDEKNCGACGEACQEGEECVSGICEEPEEASEE